VTTSPRSAAAGEDPQPRPADRPARAGGRRPGRAATGGAGRAAAGGAGRASRADLAVFAALLVVGLAVRILIYRSGWMGIDSDEATGYIMAIRGAQGHLSLLFWGGDYGGAAITWVEALLVRIFGFHFVLIWLVDTVVAVASCLALRSIARRLLTPVSASVAAGLFLFFPPLWVFFSSREYVFWSTAILFSLLAGAKTLDWVASRSTGDAVLAAFCLGLAIWSYPLAGGLILPSAIAIVLLTLQRRQLAQLAAAAAAAVAGVSPWLAYFAVHGSSAFQTQSVTSSRIDALKSSVSEVLPTALIGGQRQFGLISAPSTRSSSLLEAVGLVAIFASVALLVWFAVTRRWALAGAALAVVVWPLVLTAGHVPDGVVSFRYGFIVVPPLLIEAAYLASRLRLSLVLAGALGAMSVYVSGHDTGWYAASPICPGSLQQLDTRLAAQGHTKVFAAYWMAEDMTVCSGGRVQAGSTTVGRDALAGQEAAAQNRPVYVDFAGNAMGAEIRDYVTAHPGVAERQQIDGYSVWYFHSRVEPAQIRIESAF
jgi:hypothetical protein